MILPPYDMRNIHIITKSFFVHMQDCTYWEALGECDGKFKDFMELNCPRSCLVCTDEKPKVRLSACVCKCKCVRACVSA